MFRRFSVNFALFSIIIDGLVIAVSLIAATYSRPVFNALPFVKTLSEVTPLPWIFYILFPFLWVGILLLLSVYDGRKNFRVVDEFTSVTLASFLAAVSMAGTLYLTVRMVSRFLFLSFVAVAYLLMLVWRGIVRMMFRAKSLKVVQKRRVLVVGAGEGGRRLQDLIANSSDYGLVFVGYLDDNPYRKTGRLGILGPLENVREVIKTQAVDDVVIALPRSADERLNRLVAELHDLPVKVWIIPDYFSLALHRASVEEFANIPMLDLRAPALSEYQRMLKRAFDLGLTILALPFVLLLTAVVAVAIRLDSPGPVFYRAKRVGENGKVFEMVKFRSMVQNADQLRHLVEEVDGEGHILQKKKPDDPRVTRVGRFLRHTSLDELPQLYNVLRGDMSLVGPRPELPYLVEKYALWQRKRFAVPQGMTGWWQVTGRSDKPMYLNTEDDLFYVQHYSLWLDLQILVKTIWAVLRGKGAY